ncbi:hypothetical protein K456DRAFT_1064552 [Colletotrichum gloeosporioides 23]|nr:hypothetical protein K456DRAFT_1064552 [Colletotrichum gloeosporioides 23]
MILTVSAISITPSPHPFCRVPSFPFVLRTILPPSPTCRSIHSPRLPAMPWGGGWAGSIPHVKKKVLTVDMPLLVVVVGGTSLCSVVRPPPPPPPLAACTHDRIPASPPPFCPYNPNVACPVHDQEGGSQPEGRESRTKKGTGCDGGVVTEFNVQRRRIRPCSPSAEEPHPQNPLPRLRPPARDRTRETVATPNAVRPWFVSCRVVSCRAALPSPHVSSSIRERMMEFCCQGEFGCGMRMRAGVGRPQTSGWGSSGLLRIVICTSRQYLWGKGRPACSRHAIDR